MTTVVCVRDYGGPEVLTLEERPTPVPGPGEALVRHTVIGVNFIDTYFRTGLYKPPGGLPFVPGSEGAGIVVSVGDGVRAVRPGDRVVYAGNTGSYATERTIAADRLVPVPEYIDDATAAAVLLKGLTAQYLLRRTFRVEPGQWVLFHAGAGGVGLLAGQWLAHLGARTITTVGSDDKVALARKAGYEHVINYRSEDFVARVNDITGGAKCHVVYDSVGKDTFPASLDCLRPLGLFASFGNASGPVPAFELSLLSQKGSLFATRPTLFHYVADRADLLAASAELFGLIRDGVISVTVGQTFPLAAVADCHRALASRATTGSTLLTV